MNIIQITPRLPPALDGVGDYSLELANGLLEKYGVVTHFLTCQEGFKPEPVINNFPVVQLPAQTPAAFLDSLPKNIDKVILQFSDCPYDQKYCSPFWLLEGLKAAKQQQNFKLLVMFHEFPRIYLRKTLYLYPIQNFVAQSIAKLADIVFTNNSVYQTLIRRGSQPPVKSIPVFSNVGEPEDIPPLNERIRRLVVFGSTAKRAQVYHKMRETLVNTCRLLEIEEISDVGTPLNLNTSEIEGVRLVEMGRKTAQDISKLMLNSIAGIAPSYNNQLLTKSGVFAAYCAHGLVPVITQGKSSIADKLEVGKNFFYPDSRLKNIDIQSLQAIANNAHSWYANHSKLKTVELFASQLGISK